MRGRVTVRATAQRVHNLGGVVSLTPAHIRSDSWQKVALWAESALEIETVASHSHRECKRARE